MWWFWPWWWWVLGPREIELPVDRSRLEKFIGMLGSDHDGERANAARFISKMAQENRLTILELLKSAFGGSAHIYEKAKPRDDPPWDYSPWDDIRAARERDRKAREARDKEESDRAYWQKQKREREEANAYRQQQHERAARERARRSAFDDLGPDKEEAARRWGGTKFDDVPPSESQWDAQQRARTAKRRSAKRNSGEPLI